MKYAGWLKLDHTDTGVVLCLEDHELTYSLFCECSPLDTFPIGLFHGYPDDDEEDTNVKCPLCCSMYQVGEECEVSRERLDLIMAELMGELDVFYIGRSVRRFIVMPKRLRM